MLSGRDSLRLQNYRGTDERSTPIIYKSYGDYRSGKSLKILPKQWFISRDSLKNWMYSNLEELQIKLDSSELSYRNQKQKKNKS
jgi:hypothetical protein